MSTHNVYFLEEIKIFLGYPLSGAMKRLYQSMQSCILCHRGVQLILAYSWARPAILAAGKGRGGIFLFLQCLHFHSWFLFLPCPPLSSPLLYLLSLYPLSLGDNTKWATKGWCVVKPQHNQSVHVVWSEHSLSPYRVIGCCYILSLFPLAATFVVWW